MKPGSTSERGAAVLLGAPGAGKSTFARALLRPGIALLATGQLLKERAQSDSLLGRKIKPYVEQGELVPTELVEEVLRDALTKAGGRHVLFDGFPRAAEQVEAFFRICRSEQLHLQAVILLTLGKEEVIARISQRRVCPHCGAVYNLVTNPPETPELCDQCGGRLVLRDDDHPESVERRFKEYERQTKPVEEFFRREFPRLTYERSGNFPIEQTAEEARHLLEQPV